jgi:hypothetical protein
VMVMTEVMGKKMEKMRMILKLIHQLEI